MDVYGLEAALWWRGQQYRQPCSGRWSFSEGNTQMVTKSCKVPAGVFKSFLCTYLEGYSESTACC